MPAPALTRGTAWTSRLVAVGISLAPFALGAAEGQPEAGAGDESPPKVVISFEQRTRVEGLSGPFRLDELGPTRVLAFRTRLQIAFPRIAGPLGAFVELQDSRSTWNDRPFVVRARHINVHDIKQAHVRLVSAGLFEGRASGGLLLGRYTLDLGRRRLIARNGMRNTTNAFDGVYGWIATREGSSLQAFVSSPVLLEPYELDRSATSRLFWGSALTVGGWRPLEAQLYVLRLDERGDTLTRRRYTTLGGRLYREPSPGHPDFEVELSWQGGTQDDRVHRASFAHLEAGFTFRRGLARVAVLFDHASGDRDPDDDRSGRFDTLFGARSFEYGPTGIYGPFFRANIEGPGARVSLIPAPRLELTLAYRTLWLAQSRDAWVGSGLHDPSGASGRFLGHPLEAWVRWRPLRWLLVEGAYAHFFKGSFVETAPGSPRTPDSDYVTVGFQIAERVFAWPSPGHGPPPEEPVEKGDDHRGVDE
jgi:hypothetical protein